MNNKFSENLKKIRKEHNLSQENLADELGVSRQAISKWESSNAYPEMDKIIALCDKFDLNIDDLLHRDIKEAKGEEESKKKLNSSIEEFLKFITNTIDLFAKMSFKNKIKCLFEQIIITITLLIISRILSSILESIFSSLLYFLPYNVNNFIINILHAVLIIACSIISIIILVYTFKIRYLDYYEKIKIEDNTLNIKNNEDSEKHYKKNDNKIIIRDPEHGEYKFINGLLKVIIIFIKGLLLWFSIFIALILIGIICSTILTFLIYKTGIFFIGILTTLLSSATITIVILLLILNFIFNRKSNKKKLIWCFIISLITFGIGCGLTFIGTLNFKIDDERMLKTEIKEYEMNENLVVQPYYFYDITYVESDNENIIVEYSINKYCEINDYISEDNIIATTSCHEPTKLAREVIKNINNKIIVPITNDIYKITVYTSKSNIEKLKENFNNIHNNEENFDEDETNDINEANNIEIYE